MAAAAVVTNCLGIHIAGRCVIYLSCRTQGRGGSFFLYTTLSRFLLSWRVLNQALSRQPLVLPALIALPNPIPRRYFPANSYKALSSSGHPDPLLPISPLQRQKIIQTPRTLTTSLINFLWGTLASPPFLPPRPLPAPLPPRHPPLLPHPPSRGGAVAVCPTSDLQRNRFRCPFTTEEQGHLGCLWVFLPTGLAYQSCALPQLLDLRLRSSQASGGGLVSCPGRQHLSDDNLWILLYKQPPITACPDRSR